jgi:hypothetical protein
MRSRLLAKDAPGAPAPLALKTLLAETAEATKKTAPGPEASRLIVPGSGTAGGLSGSAMVRSYS